MHNNSNNNGDSNMATATTTIAISSAQRETLLSAMHNHIGVCKDLGGLHTADDIEELELLHDMIKSAQAGDVVNDFTL